MAHVKFEGVDEDLTAPNTPWIYYGVYISYTDACRLSCVLYSRVRMLVHARRI
jgi:hypothetical protein